MAQRYYSYTQGNGPWHILGKRPQGDVNSRRREACAREVVFGPTLGRRGFEMRDRDLMDSFGPYPEADHSVYSDRMFQWDSEKFVTAKKEACGNKPFYHCSEEELGHFLSLYNGTPQEFVALWQGNNASNGFEYWIFFYNDPITEQDFA